MLLDLSLKKIATAFSGLIIGPRPRPNITDGSVEMFSLFRRIYL